MMATSGQIVFVSGLSGSGKTTAMAALEDLSFYCVDNLPAQLVPQFLDLCAKATPPIAKVALAVDSREEAFLRRFPELVRDLRSLGGKVDGIFLDCSNDVLQNRYRETRRVHPQSPDGSVEEGIDRERRLLTEVAGMSNYQIDTSVLNVHQLKETVMQLVSGRTRGTVVNVISFGFRYGSPQAAELLFDLRFLPNPYFEEELRKRTGMDAEVADYVLKSATGSAFFERLRDFTEYLLPLYDAEGKAYVTIGVGCTGGRHRSVAVAQALAACLRERPREVNVDHRDVERAQ
jgi:UPF0042 nucleotide-binding protein